MELDNLQLIFDDWQAACSVIFANRLQNEFNFYNVWYSQRWIMILTKRFIGNEKERIQMNRKWSVPHLPQVVLQKLTRRRWSIFSHVINALTIYSAYENESVQCVLRKIKFVHQSYCLLPKITWQRYRQRWADLAPCHSCKSCSEHFKNRLIDFEVMTKNLVLC